MSNLQTIYFKSPVSLKNPSISNVTFYRTEKYIHGAWYNREEKAIFLSSSIDGKMFTVKPTKIMDVEGEVKDIKIIAKDEDFVITAIEERKDGLFIRAATGILLPEQRIYDFKPCEKAPVKGELINAYTAFTNSNSTDYIYFIPQCPEGQHFDIQSEKCVPNNGGGQGDDDVGETQGSHCTRLSILNKQKN